jgi:FkbM family methyltransferase
MAHFHPALGFYDRFRRALRRKMLQPVLLGIRSFRETILNALADRKHLIYCQLPEGNFFVDPSDRVIGSSLMWQGRWQWEEIDEAVRVLKEAGRLKDDSVFVDVGANIGTQTVHALRAGPFSRGVAFEPEQKNAKLLNMNLAANGMAARVTVFAKAAGATDGEARLFLHPRNKGAHAIDSAPSPDTVKSVLVPVTRLDTTLRALNLQPDEIGLIWIDVEGAESETVKGLGNLVGRVPLAIEYAPERLRPSNAELRAILEKHYPRLYRLGSERRGEEPIANLAGVSSMTDILFY